MPFSSTRFIGFPRLEQAAVNNPPMRYGETGNAVRVIQQAIIDSGIPMPVTSKKGSPDGIYMGETKRCVKEFQRRKPFVIADDGIVGTNTMAKLDDFFKSRPTPVKPVGPVLPKGHKERQDEIIRRLVEEGDFVESDAVNLAKNLMALKLVTHGTVLLKVLEIGSIGFAAGVAAVAAQIGFVIGFLNQLDKTMNTPFRITRAHAFAYGMTAFAFNKPRPYMSKQLKEHHRLSGKLAGSQEKHEKAWGQGVAKVVRAGPAGATKCMINGKPVGVDVYKLILCDWGDNRPGRFCFKFSQELSKKIEDTSERSGFVANINARNAVLYPY